MLDQQIGQIRVRSKVFSIEGDLEQAGQRFQDELTASLGIGGVV